MPALLGKGVTLYWTLLRGRVGGWETVHLLSITNKGLVILETNKSRNELTFRYPGYSPGNVGPLRYP